MDVLTSENERLVSFWWQSKWLFRVRSGGLRLKASAQTNPFLYQLKHDISFKLKEAADINKIHNAWVANFLENCKDKQVKMRIWICHCWTGLLWELQLLGLDVWVPCALRGAWWWYSGDTASAHYWAPGCLPCSTGELLFYCRERERELRKAARVTKQMHKHASIFTQHKPMHVHTY